ncbi:hypothetical protein [Paenibacillus elgii]|uniref:hypothetical protein n=1 Tax=Paenibacillus elgii TaxID=189691 RepID=UPI00203AC013|nr:hypothetical protein [Paenibacillus elgii]MCM3272615.1 hypothetical protein [Paenibacillus elgii]
MKEKDDVPNVLKEEYWLDRLEVEINESFTKEDFWISTVIYFTHEADVSPEIRKMILDVVRSAFRKKFGNIEVS